MTDTKMSTSGSKTSLRQRLDTLADAEARNTERIARYTDYLPGRLACAIDYPFAERPDPAAYQRMTAIRDALPARHEQYIRRRVTRRGKGPVLANPRKY